MRAIFYNELKLYMFSWLGWSALIIINIVAALGIFSGIAQYGLYTQLFYFLDTPIILSILIIGSRSLSRDRELGLFSLFFTSPIKLEELFLGKLLALVSFFLVALFGVLFYPIFASFFLQISWLSVISSIFAMILQIVFFSSITIFASSVASNSMLSIVFGISTWIVLNLLGSAVNFLDPNLPITNFIKHLSYNFHFTNINSGNFSISDILFYIIGTIFFLKLAESKTLTQVAK